nr:hypothetical protein [Tanacetum cinerariifolium]
IKRWRYNRIPAESKFKTSCSIIKDKYMMKAQVHVSKSSAISGASFSSKETTLLNLSCGGIKENDIEIKIQDLRRANNVSKEFPRTRLQVSRKGKGSGTPTEPHHIPSQEAQPSSPTHISTSSIPTVIPIPTVTQSDPTPLRQHTRRARIAQSSALPPVADKLASPVRDVSKGEACPTDSGFIVDQDKATIAKSSTLPP